ncbi:MAG: 6-bladed beta-propeller, partial [Gemmatimonadetes bacterium]|nr:6-bladed beta-propeller [Gemmatimonadota bacterium]
MPTLRIGSETAGAAYMFTTIRQVVASDSEVFVLPAETPEIRVFGADGRHRRTIGRRGAGPGEFDAVTAIGLVGDTLWTLDSNLRRVTLFRANGELLTTARLETMSP